MGLRASVRGIGLCKGRCPDHVAVNTVVSFGHRVNGSMGSVNTRLRLLALFVFYYMHDTYHTSKVAFSVRFSRFTSNVGLRSFTRFRRGLSRNTRNSGGGGVGTWRREGY